MFIKFKYIISSLQDWWNNKVDRPKFLGVVLSIFVITGFLVKVGLYFTVDKNWGYTTVGPALNVFQDIGPKTTPNIDILSLAKALSPKAFGQAQSVLEKGLKRVKSLAVQTELTCWIHCITTRARMDGKFADFNDNDKLIDWSCALSNPILAQQVSASMADKDRGEFISLAKRIYQNSIQEEVEAVVPLYKFACTVRSWLDQNPGSVELFVFRPSDYKKTDLEVVSERNYEFLKAVTKDFQSKPMALVEFNRHSLHDPNPKSLWELFDSYCSSSEDGKTVTKFLGLYNVLSDKALLQFVKKESDMLEFCVRIDFHWIYLKVFRAQSSWTREDLFVHQWYDSSIYIQHNLTVPAYGRLKYQFSLLVQMAIQEEMENQKTLLH